MARMRVVVARGFGGPEVLEPTEAERPSPGRNEVLVRIAGTSVNPIDRMACAGEIPDIIGPDRLPFVPGWDVAGTIEQVGEGVERWREGATVFAMPALDRGSYAEFIVLKADEAAAAPQAMPLADAGVVPLAALTAWQGLIRHGGLRRGQRVLIHGGSGGVGHFAVQFARAAGAIVLATASARNLDLLRDLGAETAIDYKNERFEDVAGHVDLVLDLNGGDTQRRSWSVVSPGGTLISTVEKPDDGQAAAVGARPGQWMFAQPSHDDLTEIARLIDAGEVKAIISERFPLDRVADAQSALGKGGVRGKIAVDVAV